jgi:hypothetical protein
MVGIDQRIWAWSGWLKNTPEWHKDSFKGYENYNKYD